MASMADPMIALLSFQEAVNGGDPTVNPLDIGNNYIMIYDEPNGGKRFSYAKIINRDVLALSIFGLTDPIDGVSCFSVGYAVNVNHRGNGLAIEAVNKGIKELVNGFGRTKMRSFYIEAVIDETNIHSINVAEKLFSCSGASIKDSYTGTPALYFKRLVTIR